MLSLDVIFILTSALLYAIYCIALKKISMIDILIFLFWVHAFTYVGYLSIYIFQKFILAHDVFFIEELLYEFTLVNAPLYFLLGMCVLGSLLIFNALIVHYDVSRVLMFAQISLLFTMVGYIILGSPLKFISILSALTIALGATLSLFNEIPWPHITESIKKIPTGLVLGVIAESLLLSLKAIITYFLTEPTAVNREIMHSLRHLYPFSFHNPFLFNIGARFFIMLTFLLFLWSKKQYRKDILSVLKNNFIYILPVSVIYLISCISFQNAYWFTQNREMIDALNKLSIPLILLLSAIILNEKMSMPKIVGAFLIVLGGLIVLF